MYRTFHTYRGDKERRRRGETGVLGRLPLALPGELSLNLG